MPCHSSAAVRPRRALALLVAALLVCTAAPAATPAPTEDGLWYYTIGGAEPVSPPTHPGVVSMTLGGSAALRFGHSCGKFDPVLAVQHTLNNIAAGADRMLNAMTAAASAAIAALPALILQRANPGLYDLFQNALLKAEETLNLATKSCEQMEAEIAAGKNPYADLITLSKGNDWKVQMGIGGNDVWDRSNSGHYLYSWAHVPCLIVANQVNRMVEGRRCAGGAVSATGPRVDNRAARASQSRGCWSSTRGPRSLCDAPSAVCAGCSERGRAPGSSASRPCAHRGRGAAPR